MDRNRIKYYDRGYRFSLLEAGHLGQNICLLAEKRKLGSCPLGGYIDSEVDKLLDIQNTKEVTLLQMDGKIQPERVKEILELSTKVGKEIYEAQKKALKEAICEDD